MEPTETQVIEETFEGTVTRMWGPLDGGCATVHIGYVQVPDDWKDGESVTCKITIQRSKCD